MLNVSVGWLASSSTIEMDHLDRDRQLKARCPHFSMTSSPTKPRKDLWKTPQTKSQTRERRALENLGRMDYIVSKILETFWRLTMAGGQQNLVTANEAASVTGVPLQQVHRIIDAGLLEGAVRRRDNARLVTRKALVGLKLAHDTADVLTPETRRAIVTALIRRPNQPVVRAEVVVVDSRSVAKAVRSGLDQLARARRIVSRTPSVLGGVPVFKGTRIQVHDIAEMLANGDSPAAIVKAYPQLDADRIKLAAFYASAYPRRGRPPTKLAWRKKSPKTSETLVFGDLPKS